MDIEWEISCRVPFMDSELQAPNDYTNNKNKLSGLYLYICEYIYTHIYV